MQSVTGHPSPSFKAEGKSHTGACAASGGSPWASLFRTVAQPSSRLSVTDTPCRSNRPNSLRDHKRGAVGQQDEAEPDLSGAGTPNHPVVPK